MSKVQRFIKDLMTDPHPDTPRCLCLQRMPTDVPFLSLHYHGQEATVWTAVVGVDSGWFPTNYTEHVTKRWGAVSSDPCPLKNVSFTLCLNLTRNEVDTRVSLNGMVCVYSAHWAQVMWATYKLVTTKWQFIFDRILLHMCWECLWALAKAGWGATCKKWNYHSAEDLVS